MLLRHRAVFRTLALVLFAASGLTAQAADAPRTRSTELQELLRRLHTTARMVQTTAHPDDEDGGMLTLESRGRGADVLLLTLTRGEGGQNKVGSNLLDVLGELRTLELLAADKYYGVEQRFTRVADFGFSKTADETFQKWNGHDAALEDMVRVIRTFRPDVLVSRFSGTPRDGHGHHQASGILTKEAFRAAADPIRFPEQIKEGLAPWQAKKLYIGVRSPEDATLTLNTGEVDPLLGMSYAQYAMQGLKHQLSQGAGAWDVPPGPRRTYYKLVESVLPVSPGAKEKDFFDGIDTSLPGLASRLGDEERLVPFLRPALLELQVNVEKAGEEAKRSSEAAAVPLLTGLKIANELIDKVEKAKFSAANKQDLLDNLRTKRDQFERAANVALGVELSALADSAAGSQPPPQTNDVPVAVPGREVDCTVALVRNGQEPVSLGRISLELPPGWSARQPGFVEGAPARPEHFVITVPKIAQITRPYWRRNNPETDALYTVDGPQYATLPLMPPRLRARATYLYKGLTGTVETDIRVRYRDASEVKSMPLAVAPALSVSLEPAMRLLPAAVKDGMDVKVTVVRNVPNPVHGRVRLQLPAGWRSQPEAAALEMKASDRRVSIAFHVNPGQLQEARHAIRAVVDYEGNTYSEGYTVVTRPDLDAASYYQPATERISVVDVKVPENRKVGYIMGAGDDIPNVIRQVGMEVVDISSQELASGNLSRYDTIVVGIRAYDTREDVRKYNQRLLDYVQAGGTLLVQYNAAIGEFNGGGFTPYPLELSRERVTVEEAPVQVLATQSTVFHFPNEITSADFQGWVQERGLYFADKWDSHFQPLLESHDPGEPPLQGGLLYARYGKGVYMYTGYSFFRQLPAGVPGAIRLFVNLVSSR